MDVISTKYPTAHDAGKIMPLRHNWSETYRFSMEFKSDIIISYNGKEQRRAVREYPRFSVEMSAILYGEEKLQWEYLNTLWGNKPVYVTLDFLAVLAREWLNPEETNLRYKTRTFKTLPPFWVKSGMVVVLSASQALGVKETRTVSSSNDEAIDFVEESLAEFQRNSQCAPAYLAYMEDNQQSSHYTSRAGSTAVKFNFLAQELYEIDDITAPVYVGASEFFDFRPDWRNGVEVTYTWVKLPVDYGFGIFDNVRAIEYPIRLYKANFNALDIEEVYGLLNFFQRHKGMNREFFMATWEDDVPFSSLSGGGLSILINGTSFGLAYRDSTVFRRILIRYADGTVGQHKVDYIEALPDTDSSVLRVTEPLPVSEITPQNVRGISWVLCARFAADRMDVDFQTSDKASISIPIQTLENNEL